jgi:NADH-quinone oxidoreductase subunit N
MTQLFKNEAIQAINILALEVGLFSWAMLSLIIAVLIPATRKLLINLQPIVYLLLAVIGYCYHWDLQGSLFGGSYLQYSFHIQVKIILLVIASGVSYIYLAYCNTAAKLASPEYLVLITLAMFGFFAAISARDLLLLFIALEISSLVQYVLAAYNTESRESTEAGIKYFTIGALSSCVMLLGISYIYGFTGSLSYDSFYHLVNQESSWYYFPPAIFKFAITLVIIGLAFKLSLAPFHFWTPDVYQGSPAASTAFFTTVSKIVIAVILATILIKVFPSYSYLWRFIIQVIAATSMIVGAFGGLAQTHLKRLFAYSTIMSSGLAMIAVLAANDYGMSAAINYIIVTSLMNLAIFAIIITCLQDKADQATLEDLNGLGYSHKFAGCCMAILMFSYIGIPPFAGFFTKLYLLKAALLSEFYLITIVAVISTVVSAVYYLRIVKMMYLGTSENKLNSSYLASMFLLIILVISFICSYFAYPVFLVEFN